ncbi:phage minor head protein [Psychrobacter pygoscelis]|uniref:phage head morphogenesis protein n=1 Tax=Psychrobacter pygoscelis TaxID=2488563 RepID=UPI00103A97A2|nr:phage minor head protein [Psychrobacter pygoscelis]
MPQSKPTGGSDSNINLSNMFNRRADAAIEYLQSKKPKASIDYAEVKGRAHDHAFVVAKMTDLDITAQVQRSLVTAMEENMSFTDWRDTVKPMLQDKGWWGKKEMLMDDGTSKTVQLGSDHRLKTIYNTNINQAYYKAREHHGDYDIYPYAIWITRQDKRCRPSHRALHNKIFRRADPYYQSIKPRKAWNCRCDEILLTAKQAQQYIDNEGAVLHEDISEYVSTEIFTVQGGNGAYEAPVNILRLPGQPVYRTDPGWVHAGDALPIQPMLDKAAQVPALLGANSMTAVLTRQSVLSRFNNDVKEWVKSVDPQRPKGEFRHVGVVAPKFIPIINERGIQLDSAVITLHDRITLQHLSRAHKNHNPEWVANIVQHLAGKHALYWDNINQYPVLVFDVEGGKYKMLVQIGKRIKGRDAVDAKQNYVGNVIRTIVVDTVSNVKKGNNYTYLADSD